MNARLFPISKSNSVITYSLHKVCIILLFAETKNFRVSLETKHLHIISFF